MQSQRRLLHPVEFLRACRSRLAARRVWGAVVAGIATGLTIAGAFAGAIYLLATRTKGLAHDLLITSFISFIAVVIFGSCVAQIRACFKRRRFKGAIPAFFGILVACLFFQLDVFRGIGLYHLRRISAAQVDSIQVGTKEIRDRGLIDAVVSCLHHTEWSEASKGYSPTVPFVLTFTGGRQERYWIAANLSRDRVILDLSRGRRWNHGKVAIPGLSQELERRGVWRTEDRYHNPDYRHVLTEYVGVTDENTQAEEVGRIPGIQISAVAYPNDIVVQLEVSNPRPAPFHVLKWNLAEDGRLTNALFDVSRDGRNLEYTGMMVKRSVDADSYLTIEPGRSYTRKISLRQGYDVAPKGLYTIQYKTLHQWMGSNVIAPLTSNVVRVEK